MSGNARGLTAAVLAVVALTTFMDGFDGTMVYVALPVLGADFGVDTGLSSWVTAAYYLTIAGLVILFARVAKRSGVREVLVAGFALFALSSLAITFTPDFTVLLACRFVQGAGAAMMGAAGPMACVRYLPAKRLGFGMAVLTMGWSLGYTLGPPLGGLLTDLLGWRWMFLINVPIGLAAILLCLYGLPRHDHEPAAGRLDAPGAVLLFAAVAAAVVAVETAAHPEQRLLTVGGGLAAIALLTLFAHRERHVAAPLLNVRVFRHLDFTAVFLSYVLLNLAYAGAQYLMPFYLEIDLGMDTTRAGLYMLIPSAITFVLCLPFGRLSDRHGDRWTYCTASSLLLCAACALAAWAGPGYALAPMLAVLVLMGLCWATCGGPAASRIVEHTADESPEMGSSLANESPFLGMTFGASVFGMLFSFSSGAVGVEIGSLTTGVFTTGFVWAMIGGAAIGLVGTVLSAVVRDRPRRA